MVTNTVDTLRIKINVGAWLLPLGIALWSQGAHLEPARRIRPAPKPPAVETLEHGFAGVAARVSPAVVNIQATKNVPPDERDPFAELFGELAPGSERQIAQGSGVIVSPDGRILTTAHIVDGAFDVRVSFAGGRELEAKVLGTDPKTDIALLDVDADDLPFLPLGDSDAVRVGDFALALGNPFGVGQTVTLGIVSATGRGELGIVDYEDFIQTDAAINPGNSGGALVNTSGELVGIATAIVTGGSLGNSGVGFAVPSKMAGAVMEEVLAHGRVIRGWLGVAVQDVTASLREELRLGSRHGALVGDVVKNGPAAQAGLRRGDVIVRVDGDAVPSARAVRLRIAESKPGTTSSVTIARAGKQRDLRVVLREAPEDIEAEAKAGENPPRGMGEGETESPGAKPPVPPPHVALGIEVTSLTDDLATRLAVPAGTRGVVVAFVVPGSRSDEAGLVPGDVIIEVDERAVKSPADLKRAVTRSKDRMLLLVMHEGSTNFVVVEP